MVVGDSRSERGEKIHTPNLVPAVAPSVPEASPHPTAQSVPRRRVRAKVRPKQPLAGVSDITRLLADPTPPKLGRCFVSRPRLVRRLQDEVEASTAILTAPPGYGKTRLLPEYARPDAPPAACDLPLAPTPTP